MENLKFEEYKKSNLKNSYIDGGLYYPKNEFEYIKSNYEHLTDSNGNKHYVCIGRDSIKYKFNDEDFKEHNDFFYHDFLKAKTVIFQFNLKKYQIVLPSYKTSLYDEVYNLCFVYNENKNKYESKHWKLRDLDYFPLYENVFTSGNNHEISHYINDKTLFDLEDREYIMDRVDWRTKLKLENVNFLSMSNKKYKDFLVKRFKDKIIYVKKYNQLFN